MTASAGARCRHGSSRASTACGVIAFDRPEARNAFDARHVPGGRPARWSTPWLTTGAGGGADRPGQGVHLRPGPPRDGRRRHRRAPGPGAGSGFRALLDVVVSFDKPLLAAVHGVGVGLGCTLLGHVDLVLMDEDARLRVPFAEMGVPPEAASSWLLPARMGWQRAAAMLLASEWIDAGQAVASGSGPSGLPERHGARRRPSPWPDHRLLPAARHPGDQAPMMAGPAGRPSAPPGPARRRPSPPCSPTPPPTRGRR